MASDDNFPNNNKTKSKLRVDNLTEHDLKNHLLLKFGTFRNAGYSAGISEDRIHQIFSGYCVPKSVKLIKQLAKGWGIDEVVLTKVLEGLRK